MTGIDVRTSMPGTAANDTSQGVRLFCARHLRGNNLERVGTPESDQSPACARWHGRQNCPSGSIATGVQIHTNGAFARGIALRCTDLDGRD